ncbi:MAG: hypothetical protein IPL80_08955 [Sterolibacteriaceae bacterium]|jgi:hypothetical protein|nr:hypothetical protein [Sterolibacteriaceae bacterium]
MRIVFGRRFSSYGARIGRRAPFGSATVSEPVIFRETSVAPLPTWHARRIVRNDPYFIP